MLTKQFLNLLTLSAVFAANAETLTVESDLAVEGSLSINNSTIEVTDPINPELIDLSSLATEDYVDSKISSFEDKNLLDLSSWTIGSGSTGIFIKDNGLASEYNVREWDITPFGSRGIIWKGLDNLNSPHDGGWSEAYFDVDHTKTYRFSVWLKKVNSKDGATYFGTTYVHPDNDPDKSKELLNLDGSKNWNPYFWSGDLPELDKWYLLVGYVHGSGDASTTSYGKMYDGETGEVITNLRDFKFQEINTKASHRAFFFGSSNTNDAQYQYAPRVDIVNGNEPSIAALLGGVSNASISYVDDKVDQLASDAIVDKTYLGHSNFTPLPRIDDPITRNYFASADKRFDVSYTGVLENVNLGRMFDGTTNGYIYNRINPGESVTLTIDLTAKGNSSLAYPNGRIYISTYYTRGFQVVGARMQYMSNPFDSNNPFIVKDLVNNVKSLRESGVYKDTLWQISVDSTHYAQILEIDLHNPGTELMSIAEIEYILDRPLSRFGSVITKYGPETLHHTLNFKNAAGDETMALNPETGVISAKSITLEESTITDDNQLTTKAYVDSIIPSASELLHPNSGAVVLYVDTDGSVKLSNPSSDIPMGSFTTE